MTTRSSPKGLALRLLPERVLHCAKKIHYAQVLRRFTEDEEPDLRVVKFLVNRGECVADIGANIGVYSKYLSEQTGPSGHVISIEPIPATYEILCSNMRRLTLKNVETRNCAISDMVGQVTMIVPEYDSGGENFYAAHIKRGTADESLRCFTVQTLTVDALLSSMPVQFVKCDVEGHEYNCIRGAAGTIERSKPAWLIEVSGDMAEERSRSYATRRILADSGYRPCWYDGMKLREWQPGTRSVNYFFLTDQQVANLGAKGLPLDI